MKTHIADLSLYCYHTDLGGVVYHSNYLQFFDFARTEWIKALGYNVFDFYREGLAFVVRHVEIDYLRPLTVHDKVIVYSETLAMKRSSMHILHEVRHKENYDQVYCRAKMLLVAVDRNRGHRPCGVPEVLREGMK